MLSYIQYYRECSVFMKKYIVLEMLDNHTAKNLYSFDDIVESESKKSELVNHVKMVRGVLTNNIDLPLNA